MNVPQDLVAIFHAAFHPLKGNIIDWSLKADPDIDLTNLEFNALPSGLHLVEHDVVYFSSKDGHQGVCAFLRVKSTETGHRGFRLSSLGVLLAKSTRPKPWRHVAALKDLMTMLYARMELTDTLQPTEADWDPTRRYFERHKMKDESLGGAGAGDWAGWSRELELDGDTPTLHLPHLLRILGPSTLTLYKHVIGRKRILIYTLPPVQAACILCHVAADLCWEWQVQVQQDVQVQSRQGDSSSSSNLNEDGNGNLNRLRGRNKQGINVLGMITLSDVDRLQSLDSNSNSNFNSNSNNPDSNSHPNSNSTSNSDSTNSTSNSNSDSTNSDSNSDSNFNSENGRGWIACTTDAIFIERPAYYDLLIDLTTSTPHKATRPTFYASVSTAVTTSARASQQSRVVSSTTSTSTSSSSSRGTSRGRGPTPSGPTQTHRLSTIRFAWSDVRLWNELDRILRLDSSPHSSRCHPHSSSSSSSSSSYPSSSSSSNSYSSCCTPGSPSSGFEQKPNKLKPNPTGSVWTTWTDVWRVYEDVCLVCAGLWMGMGMGAYSRNGGTGYRGNSIQSYSTANGRENWGGVRLEGDDDLRVGTIAGSGGGSGGTLGGTGTGSGTGSGSEDGTGLGLRGGGEGEGGDIQSQSQSRIRNLGAGIEGRPAFRGGGRGGGGGGGGIEGGQSQSQIRNLGAGIEGRPTANASKSSIRSLGAGIEGRPAPNVPPTPNASKSSIRSLGAGIEGRPAHAHAHATDQDWSGSGSGLGVRDGERDPSMSASASTSSSSHRDRDGAGDRDRDRARDGDRDRDRDRDKDGDEDRSDAQLLTTLALLQTFHAHTSFQLEVLESFIKSSAERSRNRSRDGDQADGDTNTTTNTIPNPTTTNPNNTTPTPIYLTPKDMLLFSLGPWSSVDERYLEWLGREYGGGREVCVRRGWGPAWRDLVGVVFGYGYGYGLGEG